MKSITQFVELGCTEGQFIIDGITGHFESAMKSSGWIHVRHLVKSDCGKKAFKSTLAAKVFGSIAIKSLIEKMEDYKESLPA